MYRETEGLFFSGSESLKTYSLDQVLLFSFAVCYHLMVIEFVSEMDLLARGLATPEVYDRNHQPPIQ